MTNVAVRKLTFEEFIRLPEEGTRYELVDGELEALMPPYAPHGRTQCRLGYLLEEYLGEDFDGYLGTEQDIPTLPYFGRRPDIVYVAEERWTEADWRRGYPIDPPDLVVEILSPGDEARDADRKRREYALVGIPNYWLVDPARRTVEVLVLGDEGCYVLEGRFEGRDAVLTTSLFPDLSISLGRIFRW